MKLRIASGWRRCWRWRLQAGRRPRAVWRSRLRHCARPVVLLLLNRLRGRPILEAFVGPWAAPGVFPPRNFWQRLCRVQSPLLPSIVNSFLSIMEDDEGCRVWLSRGRRGNRVHSPPPPLHPCHASALFSPFRRAGQCAHQKVRQLCRTAPCTGRPISSSWP